MIQKSHLHNFNSKSYNSSIDKNNKENLGIKIESTGIDQSF